MGRPVYHPLNEAQPGTNPALCTEACNQLLEMHSHFCQ